MPDKSHGLNMTPFSQLIFDLNKQTFLRSVKKSAGVKPRNEARLPYWLLAELDS